MADYHIVFDGMKDYVKRALPDNNVKSNLSEYIDVAFDKNLQDIYNLLKNVWTLRDPMEVDERFLYYLSLYYGIKLNDMPFDTFRQREIVKDLIYLLKEKGTFASIYAIYKIFSEQNPNILSIIERWHTNDWSLYPKNLIINLNDTSISEVLGSQFDDNWDGTIDGIKIADIYDGVDGGYDTIVGSENWIISNNDFEWDNGRINNIYENIYLTESGGWNIDYRPSKMLIDVEKVTQESSLVISARDYSNKVIGSSSVSAPGTTTIDLYLDGYNIKDVFIKFDKPQKTQEEIIIENSEVFNNWTRFSHDSSEDQPANSGELDEWSYNTTQDRVECTINSLTYIGFISQEKYDDYLHEVTLSTTLIGDDDLISVIIAFAIDGTGREHTLSAVRVRNLTQVHTRIDGTNTQWAIVKNYNMLDEKIIVNGNDSVPTDTGSWNDVPIGTKVRVKREDNLITAECSNFNSISINSISKLEVDLSSDPDLHVFYGPQSIGYACHSQNGSTFSNITFVSGSDGEYINIKDIQFYVEPQDPIINTWDGVIPEDMYSDHLYTSYYGKIDLASIKTDEQDIAYVTILGDDGPEDVYIDKNREYLRDSDDNIVKVGDFLVYENRLVRDRNLNVYLKYAPTYDLVEDSSSEYEYHYGYRVNEFGNYINEFGNIILTDDGLPIDRNDILIFRNDVMTDENGDVYLNGKYKVEPFILNEYGAGKYWYEKYDYTLYPRYHPSSDSNVIGDVLSTAYQVNLDLSTQPYTLDDIISDNISKNIYYLWEFIRPVTRNSDYNFILGLDVDLTGDYISIYDGVYSDMCISRSESKVSPLDDGHIEINLDNIDSWTIVHGLGLNVIIKCYDASFQEVVPKSIKLTNNSAYIKFDGPFNGMALIKKARATGLSTTGDVSTLTHRTGKKYAVTQFYNSSYISVSPKDVYSPEPNNPSQIETLITSRTSGYGLYSIQNREVSIGSSDITMPNSENPYWTVKHDFGVVGVIVDCFDPNGHKIKPLGVQFSSPNEVNVYFNMDEFAGEGSVAVVTPVGDISSIEGPIQRNPDGSLYKYEWRLGFTYENNFHKILAEDQYNDIDEDIDFHYLDRTYTGEVLKEEEDNEWVYYTIKIPKEGNINIREIGLFSDKSPIVERQNVVYTKCNGIYKPDGISMFIIYKLFKDPNGLSIPSEIEDIDFVVDPEDTPDSQYLIDHNNLYILDSNDKRIRTD